MSREARAGTQPVPQHRGAVGADRRGFASASSWRRSCSAGSASPQFGVWAVTGAIAQYARLLDFGITRSLARFVALYDAEGDRGGIEESVGDRGRGGRGDRRR